MVVEDRAKATEYLRRIGYYRLSAYWHPMRERDQATGQIGDSFVKSATFEQATDLYTFDGRLRLITMDALERIEISIRTAVALQLGRYGGKAYRDPNYFDRAFIRPGAGGGASKHRKWLQKFEDRFLASKDRFAEHFRATYPGDDMPIWVAVELLDFGPLSYLLSGMQFKDHKEMGKHFGGIGPKHLKSWVRSMVFGRNVCAHHARLWNRPLIDQPSFSRDQLPRELDHLTTDPSNATRFYALACIINYLLAEANPRTRWNDRFIAHIDTFPNAPQVDLSAAGFPSYWKEQELWQ